MISSETGERIWGGANEQLIEFEMSAAQFAELITTPNTGEGPACGKLGCQG